MTGELRGGKEVMSTSSPLSRCEGGGSSAL